MAFTSKELALKSYSGAGDVGHREYHYQNTATDTVTGANFFDPAAGQIYDGDIITDGDSGNRYQASVSAGVVSVSKITTT